MSRPAKPQFELTLEAMPYPDGPAPEIRLRRLLKFAGRVCRLRCLSCLPADAGDVEVVTTRPEQAPKTSGGSEQAEKALQD